MTVGYEADVKACAVGIQAILFSRLGFIPFRFSSCAVGNTAAMVKPSGAKTDQESHTVLRPAVAPHYAHPWCAMAFYRTSIVPAYSRSMKICVNIHVIIDIYFGKCRNVAVICPWRAPFTWR